MARSVAILFVLFFCLSANVEGQRFNPFSSDYSYALGIPFLAAAGVGSAMVVKDAERLHFYHSQFGVMSKLGTYTAWTQNIGFEQQMGAWFVLGLDVSFSYMQRPDHRTTGFGVNTRERWVLPWKHAIRPYFEYEVGCFMAQDDFPANGEQFTFRHNYKIGAAYTTPKGNQLRMDFGHLHHSNAKLLGLKNPAFDGWGLNFNYAWRY